MKCTDAEYGGEAAGFDTMLAEMQDSKYCLLLPGDSASTRALSEMMMAGCIPVLAGPPYATMPMHEDFDYTAIGVYFNVSNYNTWQTQVTGYSSCSLFPLFLVSGASWVLNLVHYSILQKKNSGHISFISVGGCTLAAIFHAGDVLCKHRRCLCIPLGVLYFHDAGCHFFVRPEALLKGTLSSMIVSQK